MIHNHYSKAPMPSGTLVYVSYSTTTSSAYAQMGALSCVVRSWTLRKR